MENQQFPTSLWTDPDRRKRLLDILKRKSYVEGTVTLASGKVSDFYIDCRQSSLDAEGAYLIGQIFHHWIEHLPFKPAAVGGMTMGADPLVTAVALTSFLESNPVNAFIIRKEAKGHGLGRRIEGKQSLKAGDGVILLEDVVTTGGSTLSAIEACESEELQVRAVFSLVDRLEGGREAIEGRGIPYASIYTRKDFKPE